MNLVLDIKKFLDKIKSFELKTDPGRYNTIIALALLVLFGALEVKTSLKELIWQWAFGQKAENNTGMFLIFMFIFLVVSIFVVFLSEKDSERILHRKKRKKFN